LHPFSYSSATETAQTEDTLGGKSPGKASTGEVIVGHGNAVFQERNAKICIEFRPKVRPLPREFVEKASETPLEPTKSGEKQED
jgi:hypothetical protein